MRGLLTMAEKQDPVHKLCSDGGLLVHFETIGTLHQCALFEEEKKEADSGEKSLSADLYWEVLGYGIPIVIANMNGVVLCLADIDSGDKICEFHISDGSQYVAMNNDFHVFTRPSGCFALGLADECVGAKLLTLLKRVVPSISKLTSDREEVLEPASKQPRTASDGDIDEEEPDGGSVDEPDGMFHRKKEKKEKREKTPIEISGPTHFEHICHVGDNTPLSQLTQAMSWTDTLKRSKKSGDITFVPIPMYSTSDDVMEVPTQEETTEPPPPPPPAPPAPPPPPPVLPPPAKLVLKKRSTSSAVSSESSHKDLASSLAEELKRGVVLRPIHGDDKSSISSQKSSDSLQEELKNGVVLRSVKSNHSMTLPMPPKRNKNEQLLFEIKTFRRNKLHRVSSNMTDFPSAPSTAGEKSMEAVMKRALDTMMQKISALNIPNVGSVSQDGEDSFDGLLNDALE